MCGIIGYIGKKHALPILLEGLKGIPELMQMALAQKDRIGDLAESYQWFEHFFFLGRKYGLPVAFEGALKLKEISYLHAEGNGAGEMKHGFIALVDPKLASIVIAVQDSVYPKMVSNIQEIKARHGPVLAIATDGDEKIAHMAQDVVYVPRAREFLQPFVTTLPLQLLAYEIAVRRGCDVDQPRNLAKSVTVE